MTLLFELSEQWQPEGRQKIITVLTIYINYLDWIRLRGTIFPLPGVYRLHGKIFPLPGI